MSVVNNKKRAFWELSLRDILGILCAGAVPIAVGIYTVVTYQQDQEQAKKTEELSINQTKETRQDTIYDQFLKRVYNLDKDGYLNESEDNWSFANAFYRVAHRQLDPERKADVLQFLKEKGLIGRNNCTEQCPPKILKDIIRLNELNFDNVHFISQTGTLNRLNLECILFDEVSMSNAIFYFANLNGASFDRGRADNAKFGNSSLTCVHFDGTDLRGVDFTNAYFKNVTFSNVDLSTTKLTEEQIKQATFHNVKGLDRVTTTAKQTTTTTSKSSTSKMTTTITTTKKISLTTKPSSTTSSMATTKITTAETTTYMTSKADTTTHMTSKADTTVITTATTMKSTIHTTTVIATTSMDTAVTTIETCTTVITFDDIPNQSSTTGLIPDGYKNLRWTNAEYINVSTESNSSIYQEAVQSFPFVMHNPSGNKIIIETANDTFFSFDSLHLTAFWSGVFNFTIQTVRSGSRTMELWYQRQGSYNFIFNCNDYYSEDCTNSISMIFGIEPVIPANSTIGNATQFIIDDLCISFES